MKCHKSDLCHIFTSDVNHTGESGWRDSTQTAERPNRSVFL